MSKTKIIVCTRIRLGSDADTLEPDDRGFRQECYSWQEDDMLTGNFLLVLFESSLFIQTVQGFLSKYENKLLELFPEDKVYLSPKGWGDQANRMFLQGYAAGLYRFAEVYEHLVTDPKEEYYRAVHIIDLDHSDGRPIVRPPGITPEAATAVRVRFNQMEALQGRKVSAVEHSSTIPDGDPEEHNVDRYGKKLNLPLGGATPGKN